MSGALPTSVGFGFRAAIDGDVTCVACGYNLRGLAPEKVCPECGTAVHRSLHGDQLRYADATWLGMIRRGIRLMLWNLLLAILVFVAMVLAKSWDWPPALGMILGSIKAALALWATLLVTAQEPRSSLVEDPVTLRRVIRICAIAMFIGAIAADAAALWGLELLLIACGVAGPVAGLAVWFGQFAYARGFARRIPDKRLAKSTGAVMWGFVIACAATVVAGLIGVTFGISSQSILIADICLILGLVGGVGFVVFGIAAIVLLFWFNSALTRVCEQAQRLAKHGEASKAMTQTSRIEWAVASGSSGELGLPLRTSPTSAAAAPGPRSDELVGRLTAALWREPGSPRVHYDLAVALAGRGRLREAVQQYEEAIHIRPDYVEAHLNLANCLLRQHHTADAIRHLERVLSLKPDLPTAHYNMGNILFREGRIDEAIRHYAAAVRVKRDFVEARLNLALALAKQGRDDEAIKQLRAVLQLDPSNTKAQQRLEAAQGGSKA
jgi:tetratricopeptide (TPR) repeat protein